MKNNYLDGKILSFEEIMTGKISKKKKIKKKLTPNITNLFQNMTNIIKYTK